jgi:hypothetical protein
METSPRSSKASLPAVKQAQFQQIREPRGPELHQDAARPLTQTTDSPKPVTPRRRELFAPAGVYTFEVFSDSLKSG